jgi:hypothetical protein
MKVRLSGGEICKVVVLLGRNKKVMRSTLNQIADSLRIDRRRVEWWLDKGSHEQLVARLERFPAEVFESPAIQRRFRQYEQSE